MSEVKRTLLKLDSGEPTTAEELLPLVYDELRRLAAAKLAQEIPGQTLQATALVHEAYVKLVGQNTHEPWNGRTHFYAAAAECMRRILVDRARKKYRQKRGGGQQRIPLSEAHALADTPDEDVLALDEALEKFSALHPKHSELVKLRYFAGLCESDAADIMGISRATASRYWAFARAWLINALDQEKRFLLTIEARQGKMALMLLD